jgi:hypothetical protein
VPAVHAWLRTAGFADVRTITPLPSAAWRAARAAWHAWRGKERLTLAYRRDRAVFHARKAG